MNKLDKNSHPGMTLSNEVTHYFLYICISFFFKLTYLILETANNLTNYIL